MPKFHRSDAAPPGVSLPVRNPRLYGSRDEQIEGAALRSRSCPNPDSAVVYRRRPNSFYRERAREREMAAVLRQDSTPAQHVEHLRIAQHNHEVLVAQARAARERGDEPERQRLVALARERRAELIALGGGTERRTIDVDQGSAVNPMVAV